MLQWTELETQPGSRFCAGLPVENALAPAPDGHALAAWLREHAADVDARLVRHGALLLRGFALPGAQDFERVALALDEALQSSYAGTSPRVARTRFVHSASELPPFYPIPQHIEMSFTTTPPRKLFFYCAIAPGAEGETPVCDFRAVYRDLDPAVRAEFERRGIRNIRNYDGPDTPRKALDFWKLKRWDELFATAEKPRVEQAARDQALELTWLPRGRLRLTNAQPAVRVHPVTGEAVWFNHVQVFHGAAARHEYGHIARRQKHLRARAFHAFTAVMTTFKNLTTRPTDQGMHCTFGDGGEIPERHVRHLQDTIWKHMRFFHWQQGDVLVLDNRSTSHGRMPYRGPRDILVAWTSA
jgi:alpha-ketoglutarate-dependent taurine dioxygenase